MRKYVFDVCEPQDGTFWYHLLSSGATVSMREPGSAGWPEVTVLAHEGARVHTQSGFGPWNGMPFEDWLSEVMGCNAADLREE